MMAALLALQGLPRTPRMLVERKALAAEDAGEWSGLGDCVVLCGARPGNVGSTLRLCAMLGMAGLVVVGLTPGKRRKATELAGIGEGEGVTIVAPPAEMEAAEVLLRLRASGHRLVGLTAHGEDVQPLWRAQLTLPGTAFVLGRENDGIPSDAEELLDEALTIPMEVSGEEGSLNVSHAAAVLLYERQRQLEGEQEFSWHASCT
ncbi:unnamed protein product [Effrenium voratum]|nr:unnamed protein product [Effrenium voratum]CAJ1421399.1 unnamed protein product [Effrenium voratum]